MSTLTKSSLNRAEAIVTEAREYIVSQAREYGLTPVARVAGASVPAIGRLVHSGKASSDSVLKWARALLHETPRPRKPGRKIGGGR